MNKINNYIASLFAILLLFMAGSCSNNDNKLPEIKPAKTGTFTDPRDNYEYHWVQIGDLQWTVENSHYHTGELTDTIYQDDGHGGSPAYSDKNLASYGYLYTYKGALAAVPEGWRLPTDEDWNKLEMALGTSADDVVKKGWRGTYAGTLLQQQEEGTMLHLQMGGYYTTYLPSYGAGYKYMSVYGFFWSSTKDTSKDGDYYFYRKLIYNSSQVFRESMEMGSNYLSVRFVRDAQ